MAKRKIPMSVIQRKRMSYVNNEFAKKVRGTHISNKSKTRLFKSLWKKARKKYK